MIESLSDYESILESDDLTVRRKATTETAIPEVWLEILIRRPELAEVVAFNKHLPNSILDLLIENSSPQVRSAIAMKRDVDRRVTDGAGTANRAARIFLKMIRPNICSWIE